MRGNRCRAKASDREANSQTQRASVTRLGRPPKDLAGDVSTRILDAAQRLFLERGYQSASLDEIAAMAPASKPTIYAHFGGKEALFTAVVTRIIDGLANFEGYEPKGRTVQDKLTSLGTELVERFIADMIGVTRSTIALRRNDFRT
jgi:AcrR family transcriptional regulator